MMTEATNFKKHKSKYKRNYLLGIRVPNLYVFTQNALGCYERLFECDTILTTDYDNNTLPNCKNIVSITLKGTCMICESVPQTAFIVFEL